MDRITSTSFGEIEAVKQKSFTVQSYHLQKRNPAGLRCFVLSFTSVTEHNVIRVL